ncbi:hypothetical protein ABW21_db0205498 [Orbilia brochopaga]|nr:hypothetical protein ABW21_db0205498 [Drechslerella brochopaga]
MAAKMDRKSPIIAITPMVKTSFLEDDTPDFSSAASEDSSWIDYGAIDDTNVYIEGLSADMTDQQLGEMVAPFGEVISSKAIIERPIGRCKGYGFARFATADAADACMVALNAKGYEASNARSILSIFQQYEHLTCRLLFDRKGNSRGVAFIDFKDRAVCDEIIERFNGLDLRQNGHPLTLQVRYADTLLQKELKRRKQATGQFPKRRVVEDHHKALQQANTEHSVRKSAKKDPERPSQPIPTGPRNVDWRSGYGRE